MVQPSDITLIPDAVHNPSEPRHFMQLVGAQSTKTATLGAHVLARSETAVIVKEVGRAVYDPVVYFPRSDVDMNLLAAIDKSTHCPLKGDTEYFSAMVDGTTVDEVAWSYVEMVEGAEALQNLIAFDTSKVVVA